MPDLFSIIAAHEARQHDRIVLTDRGRADVAARKFARRVAELTRAGHGRDAFDAMMLMVREVNRLLAEDAPRTA